eukprot:COSAG02_NODE_4247_length_5587_cov_2.359147_2_plen_1029_part_00
MVLHRYCCVKQSGAEASDEGPMRVKQSPTDDATPFGLVDKKTSTICVRCSQHIVTWSGPVLILTSIIFATAATIATRLQPSQEVPKLFREAHNIQQFFTITDLGSNLHQRKFSAIQAESKRQQPLSSTDLARIQDCDGADIDDRCVQWAAGGECQANTLFMAARCCTSCQSVLQIVVGSSPTTATTTPDPHPDPVPTPEEPSPDPDATPISTPPPLDEHSVHTTPITNSSTPSPDPDPDLTPTPDPHPDPVPTPEEPSPAPVPDPDLDPVPTPEDAYTAVQLCSESAFSSDAECAAGVDDSLGTFWSDGICNGPICQQAECCVAPQLCSDSSFSSDSLCAGGPNASLRAYSSDGVCTSTSCTQAECCVAPQLCSDSSFSSDSLCAGGANTSLRAYSSDGVCSGLECSQVDCCFASPTAATTTLDPHPDPFPTPEEPSPAPVPDPDLDPVPTPEDAYTAVQLCSESAFSSDAECAAGVDDSLGTFWSDGICNGPICQQAECCVAPQLCSDSSFSSDSLCAGGPNASLRAYSSDGVCSGLECSQVDCCFASEPELETVPTLVSEPEPDGWDSSEGSEQIRNSSELGPKPVNNNACVDQVSQHQEGVTTHVGNNTLVVSIIWGVLERQPLQYCGLATEWSLSCYHYLADVCRRLQVDAARLQLAPDCKFVPELSLLNPNSSSWSGPPRAVELQIRSADMPPLVAGLRAMTLFNTVESLVDHVINRREFKTLPHTIAGQVTCTGLKGLPLAPRGLASPAFHTSAMWPKMFLEVSVVDGTIWTIGIISLASFYTVFLFTNSLRITGCVVANILVILAVVLAIFYLDGMALGVVEAVAISVFLGTSTDYSLHVAEVYMKCCEEASLMDAVNNTRARGNPAAFDERSGPSFPDWSRRRRRNLAQEALRRISGAVFDSAMTTFLAVACLFLCQCALFVRFAEIIVPTVVVSAASSLLLLPSLLSELGQTTTIETSSAPCRHRVYTGLVLVGLPLGVFGVLKLLDLYCHCIVGPDGMPLFHGHEDELKMKTCTAGIK